MPDDEEYSAGISRDVPLKDLMNTGEVAKVTGHTVGTLNTFRSLRNTGQATKGPEFVQLGRSIFYRRDAVDAYLAKRAGL